MATHDYIISNASGAAVRADLNNALAAIATNNSSATEPTTTYAYQWWADTGSSPTVMKLRNSANSAWITLFQLDGEWTNIAFENGTAAAPSIYFKDSGTDTGIYSPGTDQVGISTNGVERVEFGTSEVVFNDGNNNYDFRIESDNNANLFFVDASVDRLGIGHGSPATLVHIADTLAGSPVTTRIENFSSSANSDAVIELKTPNETYGLKANRTGARLDLDIGGTPKISITTGGLVGIGTTSPGSRLEVGGEAAPRVGINSTGLGTPGLLFQGAGTTYGSIIENTQTGELAIKAGASGQNSYFITFGTNDGSEKARLDASGRLLVGTSTARVRFFGANNQSAQFQLEGNDSFTAAGAITRNSNDADAPSLILSKARSTTYTAVQYVNGSTSDDKIGRISFQGADGTNLIAAASIECFIDAAPGTNDMPGRLVFSTTADGASSPTERMRITSGGELLVGGTNDNGAFNIQCNGTGIWGFGAYVNGSDERLKENIHPLPASLDVVKALNPVAFQYKSEFTADTSVQPGFIAQELQVALAGQDYLEGVVQTGPEYLSVAYQSLIPVLTKALQEAAAKIETLEAKVAALEGA